MSQIAFVFPGQGSQSVGMGRALAESSPDAAAVFAAADEALGEPITRLAWEGPEEDLNRTENAQPALLAASIAYLAAVRARWAALGIDAPAPEACISWPRRRTSRTASPRSRAPAATRAEYWPIEWPAANAGAGASMPSAAQRARIAAR